jgi:hypothetical protein
MRLILLYSYAYNQQFIAFKRVLVIVFSKKDIFFLFIVTIS